MGFGIKLFFDLRVLIFGVLSRRPEGSIEHARAWLLSLAIILAFRTTRQSYSSHKFACLSPTTLLQTFTTLHNTFLFLTLRLPNQHMKENVITDSMKQR